LNTFERFNPEFEFKCKVEDFFSYRRMNSGMNEIVCSKGDKNYKIYDTGGQLNERKKWKNCKKIYFNKRLS
jgi:hypothetical protein